jgi:hypothetical protein
MLEAGATRDPRGTLADVELIQSSIPRFRKMRPRDAARIAGSLLGCYVACAERLNGAEAQFANGRAVQVAAILSATAFPDWRPA